MVIWKRLIMITWLQWFIKGFYLSKGEMACCIGEANDKILGDANQLLEGCNSR